MLTIPLKKQLKHFLRRINDIDSGIYFKFAYRKSLIDLPEIQKIALPIRPSPHYENKVQNILNVTQKINGILIEPGKIFSFWYLVKNPTQRRGYLPSRVIKQGKEQLDHGGGICQISGLIYWLALRSGMTIIERHAHSIDLYNEQTRFTPLGSDAAVAYGYKDLRFQNTLAHSIYLQFFISDNNLIGSVHSSQELNYDLKFIEENASVIKTIRKKPEGEEIISIDRYLKP